MGRFRTLSAYVAIYDHYTRLMKQAYSECLSDSVILRKSIIT
jgi:ATP-dependent protease Clp ATPase subunit